MRIFKKLIPVFALIVGSLQLGAQDIHFSQFYLSPLNLNPAMTGVMNCNVRLVANYRNQWASILKGNAYNTYSASYDQRIPVGRYDFFGVGASFFGDVAGSGDFSTLQGKLSASYSKRMGGYRKTSHYLVAGAEAGVNQRSVNFQQLRWGDEYIPGTSSGDPGTTAEFFDNTNFIFADVSAGLMWFSVFDEDNSFYIGGAFHHLNRANVTFLNNNSEPLYSKITMHVGGEFMVADRFGLVPGLIVMKQGPSFETNFGTSLKFLLSGNRRNYQAFQIGGWMRISNHFDSAITGDAFILSTKFDYQDFSIGFSYDLNVSELKGASGGNGAFEFSLVHKICGSEKRNVYCPNF